MRTEDLIAQLAAEGGPAPAGLVPRGAALGLALGGVATAALFFALLGPRPGLAEAAAHPVTLAKTLLPLAMAPLALVLALRSVRPAAPLGVPRRAILAIPIIALALLLWAFGTVPAGDRWVLFVGHSIPVCLPAITVLSMPMLFGLLRALRKGAALRPRLSGALAGLAAAGFATALYSLFCTEDSPLFYSVWYSTGILIVTGIGAAAGARMLRW